MNDMDVMYWLKMKQEGRDGETKFRVFFVRDKEFWGGEKERCEKESMWWAS